MIQAMNAFFRPTENFDTFYFDNASDGINYIPVDSPSNNAKGILAKDAVPVVPITVLLQPNNDFIYNAVAAQVIDLLENPGYKMGAPGKTESIRPSDIGILVRSNKQGRKIKNKLSRLGIPAVTIGDDRVLQSEEATYLLYLLEAMIEQSRAGINKALLSPFTGFTIKDILQLNDEMAVELFKKYKVRWDEDGVYTALKDFVADFQVQQALLRTNTENGERTITNLFHLIELVHKVQSGKLLSPLELISWLKRGIEGMETEGDEYEQRIENDEEAVKIVTIHKSKGLQYKIVLSPFMDFVEPKNVSIYSFRDEVTGDYVAVEKSAITAEQKISYSKQLEQEHRRLVYVAITRAVYKCFIYRSGYYKASTLASFTDLLGGADPSLIEFSAPPPLPEKYRYSKAKQWEQPVERKAGNFSLSHQNWVRMSYTMLAAKSLPVPKAFALGPRDQYDLFIFHQLTKGEKTGNMLHLIFETINYTNPEKWADTISAAVIRFAPHQKDLYHEFLPAVIENTLRATIPLPGSTFTIADIGYDKRIHEFEFDFPVQPFLAPRLEELSDEDTLINIQPGSELEGMMNGKVDLFFEHNGKYFVLDWKSNYLGNTLEDYSPAALSKAMNDQNYHLQYLVYTLAVKKYLQSRLPNFSYENDFGGVIYVFLRGVRKGAETGIYFVKPAPAKIRHLEDLLEGVPAHLAI
jgi:exodeoxyribonuclease V beta subunit